MSDTESKISRRDFLKVLGLGAAGGALAAVGGFKLAEYVSKTPTEEAGTLKPTREAATPTEEAGTLKPTREAATPTEETRTQIEKTSNNRFNPAEKNEGQWVLHTSDGDPVTLSLPEGYTPDETLKISSDVHPRGLLPIPENAAKFQQYLNNPKDPIAGFTDSVNDYNQYYNHESGPQLPAYSWEVFTGLVVDIPGVGRVEGGQGRAAMVLVINRTDRVYRWKTNSVRVEAGFNGWGRIWNGDADHTAEAEKRLVQHFLTRLGQGVPETGFIGQCDQGYRNCDEVTVVSVERIQWGNNPDGSPRYQFRLIRAETIQAPK